MTLEVESSGLPGVALVPLAKPNHPQIYTKELRLRITSRVPNGLSSCPFLLRGRSLPRHYPASTGVTVPLMYLVEPRSCAVVFHRPVGVNVPKAGLFDPLPRDVYVNLCHQFQPRQCRFSIYFPGILTLCRSEQTALHRCKSSCISGKINMGWLYTSRQSCHQHAILDSAISKGSWLRSCCSERTIKHDWS